jgi:Putative Actinobacterial Holin-X, holin superfamily III
MTPGAPAGSPAGSAPPQGGASAGATAAQAPGVGADTAAGPRDVSQSSIGELIGQVSGDLSTLMRQELELAKAELRQEAIKTGKGAGMLAGAGFAGYMVLLFCSIALWWGLSNVMDQGWAALIVAALWALIGAVLYVTGRRQLRAVHPKPERTVDTLKQVPDALKGR